jgi:hypothetical protein
VGAQHRVAQARREQQRGRLLEGGVDVQALVQGDGQAALLRQRPDGLPAAQRRTGQDRVDRPVAELDEQPGGRPARSRPACCRRGRDEAGRSCR